MTRSAPAPTAVLGALAARGAWHALRGRPPGGRRRWERVNHRGEPITLLEGPAFAAAAALAAGTAPGLPGRLRLAGALAAVGAGGFGLLDDLAERGTSKGLRGHLSALARGDLTTGAVKIAGIGATGLAVAALAAPATPARAGAAGRPGKPATDLLVSGALVAGTANLLNLFDLRPGRALKVGLLAAPALLSRGPAAPLVAAVAGPAVAMLPEDLGERAMLGDAGANAAGALLGTALVAGTGRRTRLAALAAVTALTLTSERVSFTRVIERTPGLRELDALGRRPR